MSDQVDLLIRKVDEMQGRAIRAEDALAAERVLADRLAASGWHAPTCKANIKPCSCGWGPAIFAYEARR